MSTWKLELPAPAEWLNSNDRRHWAGTAALTKAWRDATHVLAIKAMKRGDLPRITVPVEITATVHRTSNRGRFDAHNLAPTVKPVIDGLVDAGVLHDDSTRYVTALAIVAGAPVRKATFPQGLLTITITAPSGDTP